MGVLCKCNASSGWFACCFELEINDLASILTFDCDLTAFVLANSLTVILALYALIKKLIKFHYLKNTILFPS